MKKEYIKDLFQEGLGDIFFMKVYSFFKERIKNKVLFKIIIYIYGTFYLFFLILVGWIIFKLSFPL